MGQLIVRQVDDEVVRALKLRAAQNGRSAEAEHRAILREVLLASTMDFKQFLLSIPQADPETDVFEQILVRDMPSDPIDLSFDPSED